MSAFHPGQRVKVVNFDRRYPAKIGRPEGATGSVIRPFIPSPMGAKFEWAVRLDDGCELPFFGYELAPIVPEPSAADIDAAQKLLASLDVVTLAGVA